MLAALALLLAIDNPAIDMHGYLQDANRAATIRERHRLTEQEFLALAEKPGAVVLDARSAEKYCELHVRGAVNLSFPDFTAAALARIIPGKSSPVLIYCNNNFENAEGPFPTKASKASLNLSTYIALYTYGYDNVYELGPLVDIHASKLAFDSCK